MEQRLATARPPPSIAPRPTRLAAAWSSCCVVRTAPGSGLCVPPIASRIPRSSRVCSIVALAASMACSRCTPTCMAGSRALQLGWHPDLDQDLDRWATSHAPRAVREHGIWTQFDVLAGGYLTVPRMGRATPCSRCFCSTGWKPPTVALRYLAQATFAPPKEYVLHRDSPYWFYERLYSPDAVGRVTLEEGCGALNLVNVGRAIEGGATNGRRRRLRRCRA